MESAPGIATRTATSAGEEHAKPPSRSHGVRSEAKGLMLNTVSGFTGRKLRWAWALLQLVPGLLAAQQPGSGIARLFPPQPAGYLTDAAGIVDAASAARIDTIATRLRALTGAELAVVTLPTIQDYAPSDVALTIGRSWGVGAKGSIGDPRRNAGMVLLLVPRREDQRGQIYLATGQGIEGIVTDATAGRIQDLMIPQLREGQYGPALVTGVTELAGIVAQGFGITDSTLSPQRPVAMGGGATSRLALLLLIFVVFLVVMAVVSARARRWTRRGVVYWGGPWGGGGGWGGGFGGGGGGGGFGGFGGGGGFSGGGAGRSF